MFLNLDYESKLENFFITAKKDLKFLLQATIK